LLEYLKSFWRRGQQSQIAKAFFGAETPVDRLRRNAEQQYLKSLPKGDWAAGWPAGVLLADQICRAASEFQLISPFVINKLRPAGYELSVGECYSINGAMKKLVDEQGRNEIIVKPFDVVVIQTLERLNVPEFMIARWNVTVGRAYEGFLWVGAAQVDPGFKGYLCCPIYNLSDRERSLKLGESIAVIDFVTTTPPSDESRRYSINFADRKRVLFDDYKPDELQSALITKAQKRLDDFQKDISEIRNTVFNSLGILLAAIGTLVTALALFVSKAEPKFVTFLSPPLLVSFAALTVSLGALVVSFTKNGFWRWVIVSLVLLIVVVVMYWIAWCSYSLP
jgi:deoxycytidine triphosphate deaminase